MDRRHDYRTQLYIEAIINGLPGIGYEAAAHALRDLGVPIETALRVLTRAAERRPTISRDWRDLPHLKLGEPARQHEATKAALEVPSPRGRLPSA